MFCLPKNAASRRYGFRIGWSMALYTLFVLLAAWIFKHDHPTGLLAYALALLPALPLIAVIAIMGLYLAQEKDEFQRNVLIQSILWGIGGTLAVTTTWGFLELFAGIPHFQSYLTMPLFWFLFGVATPLLKRKYR